VLLARPATNTLRTSYGPSAGSGAVRVAGDLVWVTAHDAKTVRVLRRLARNRNLVPGSIEAPSEPSYVSVEKNLSDCDNFGRLLFRD
jgi:hypothetical protein